MPFFSLLLFPKGSHNHGGEALLIPMHYISQLILMIYRELSPLPRSQEVNHFYQEEQVFLLRWNNFSKSGSLGKNHTDSTKRKKEPPSRT